MAQSIGVTAALDFGELSDPDIGNTIGYAGYRFNAETGHYAVRFRVYSPTLGRFIQTDPAGYVDGMNRYEYAKQSPLTGTDPLGLCRFPIGENPGTGDEEPVQSPLPETSPSPPNGSPAPPSGGGKGSKRGGGAKGRSWSQCFSNCMNDHYGGTAWSACAGALGIDFLIGKTEKTAHEKKMPHKGKDYTTRLRRMTIAPKVWGPIKRLGKALYAGTVGKVVAAAGCGYAAGVSTSCAALCAADENSF